MSAQGLARLLKGVGGDSSHTKDGTLWEFPPLKEARAAWERRMGVWKWDEELAEWRDYSPNRKTATVTTVTTVTEA
jgi:hypothetical protein